MTTTRGQCGRTHCTLQVTPDGDNPHGQFARYEDVRWKAIAARNAGAKALIVIANETNFKDDRLSRLRYDNSGGDAGLPVVAVSRQTAERLLAQNSSLLAEVEQRLRAKPRPLIPSATEVSLETLRISILPIFYGAGGSRERDWHPRRLRSRFEKRNDRNWRSL